MHSNETSVSFLKREDELSFVWSGDNRLEDNRYVMQVSAFWRERGSMTMPSRPFWHRSRKPHIPSHVPAYDANASPQLPTIFVVDDERIIAFTLSIILLGKGYKALWFTNPVAAIEAAAIRPPKLLITDHNMPAMSGFQLADAIRSLSEECRVLMISADCCLPESTEFQAARLSHSDFLAKPFDVESLLQGVKQSLR